jgi:hypothetical protein
MKGVYCFKLFDHLTKPRRKKAQAEESRGGPVNRTGIRRKTRLRQSPGRLLRSSGLARRSSKTDRFSTLNKVAPKRAKSDRAAKAAGLNHCGEMHQKCKGRACWWCNRRPGSQVHHICSEKVEAKNADGLHLRDHRAGLFWTCDLCHSEEIPRVDRLAVFAVRADHYGWDEEIAYALHRSKDGREDWL